MSDFNNLLERQRKYLNFSLGQASKLIGCSKTHLMHLERGDSKNPRASIICGICESYGLPCDLVLGLFHPIDKNGGRP